MKPLYNTSNKLVISPLSNYTLFAESSAHLKKCAFYIIFKSKLPLCVTFNVFVKPLHRENTGKLIFPSCTFPDSKIQDIAIFAVTFLDVSKSVLDMKLSQKSEIGTGKSVGRS